MDTNQKQMWDILSTPLTPPHKDSSSFGEWLLKNMVVETKQQEWEIEMANLIKKYKEEEHPDYDDDRNDILN